MTGIKGLTGDRVYLDANVLIYFVEEHPTFAPFVRELFQAIEDGAISAISSELTLAEVLVKPLADNNSRIAGVYRTILSGAGPIQVATVDRAVLLESASVRAKFGGKMFDAIHVATAMLSTCDVFLSEDGGIRAPKSLRLLRPSELMGKL